MSPTLRKLAFFVLAWSSMLASALSAAGLKVVVAAGKVDRRHVPVSIDLDGFGAPKGAHVLARGAGEAQLGQVEAIDGGKIRLWWIIDELPAGEEREYGVRFLDEVPAGAPLFAWADATTGAEKTLQLAFESRPVLGYVHTPFDAKDIELTKKPFHHVHVPDGSRLITKGAGGLYPHHRGLYFGYNRCKVGAETVDTWHAQKGEHQLHAAVLARFAGPVRGGHEVKILWNDRQGKTFAEERRTVAAFRQPAGRLLIDFATVLGAWGDAVDLGGDRQHAGVQFRAAQDVAGAQEKTRYLRPAKWADLPADKEVNDAKHVGLPWNALQFTLDGKRYTVVYMSHPENPGGAEFSERLYGRFGEFFPWKLEKDRPLRARYRLWILEGDSVSREEIERWYQDYASPASVRKG
jgi:hypothetical protein